MDLRPLFYLGILALCIAFAFWRERSQKIKYEKAHPESSGKPAEKAAVLLERDSGEYAITDTGKGDKVEYDSRSCSTSRIMWVSRETAADGHPLRIRTPKSASKTYKLPLPFKAADKTYGSLDKLLAEKSSDGTYRDCYGRVVLSVTERFPCFDSHDFANENRYYRWWIIVEEGYISRIFHTDESKEIFVTDDVQDIEENCLEELKKHGYVV